MIGLDINNSAPSLASVTSQQDILSTSSFGVAPRSTLNVREESLLASSSVGIGLRYIANTVENLWELLSKRTSHFSMRENTTAAVVQCGDGSDALVIFAA